MTSVLMQRKDMKKYAKQRQKSEIFGKKIPKKKFKKGTLEFFWTQFGVLY